MRNQVIFISVLALPATAAAHNGPHDGMSMLDWIVLLPGQHELPGLAGTLVVALLLVGCVGVWCITRRRQIDINPTPRVDLKARHR